MILLLLACGAPPAPTPPGGIGPVGDGTEDTDVEDTAGCGECTLYDCEDTSDPDAESEGECESEADDQGCADWEWSAC